VTRDLGRAKQGAHGLLTRRAPASRGLARLSGLFLFWGAVGAEARSAVYLLARKTCSNQLLELLA
jgi:hypothetical protein